MKQWTMWAVLATVLSSAAWAQVDERRGIAAEFGKHYTLGKANKWDIVLKSAEYSLDRIDQEGGAELLEKANKRILLHFSVQNAMPGEQYFHGDNLPITLVDAAKASHEVRGFWYIEGKIDSAAMTLKPAQRIEAFTFIDIPNESKPAKLLVLPGREDEELILRYPLEGKIKGLAAALADPADKTGATPLDLLPMAKDQWTQIGHLDIKLVAAEDYNGKVPEADPEEGKHWYAVTVALRNSTVGAISVYDGCIKAKLLLADETEVSYRAALAAKAAKSIELELKPKAETTMRIIFELAKDDKPAKLVLTDEGEACRAIGTAIEAK